MLRLLALGALAVMSLTAPSAMAQNASFFTVTYVEVGPILGKVGISALHADRDAGRKEQGNVHLDVFEHAERSNQFVMLGAWTDQAAYDAYAASARYRAMAEKMQSLLVAPMDIRLNTALSGSVAVAPDKSARDAIVIVTHVDVIPPQKDNAVAALKQLAEETRAHPGNLQFHVWQQISRPNHFTVVEAWSSRGAFNIHQMRKETREFRDKLAPMAGALYDERIYKPLK